MSILLTSVHTLYFVLPNNLDWILVLAPLYLSKSIYGVKYVKTLIAILSDDK